MRAMMVAAALLLTACGASTESSDDVPDDDALPYGAIIGVGENWSLNADHGAQAVSFIVDDGAEPVEAAAVWTPPQPTESGYRLTAGEITLDLVEEACTIDGISHPMRATVSYGGQAYPGCAAMRWDYQLIALMPQIDACIARSPEVRWVSFAGERDGAVLVRLVADGGGFDCNVSLGADPQVSSFAPRSETLLVATDHAALFVRGPGDNPGGLCYDAPEVRGADGALLGWMMDPMGC